MILTMAMIMMTRYVSNVLLQLTTYMPGSYAQPQALVLANLNSKCLLLGWLVAWLVVENYAAFRERIHVACPKYVVVFFFFLDFFHQMTV